jgi:thymidylate synthase (FAD)
MKVIHDHGYIMLIEKWGSDERVIEAARMSTGKGFLGWDKDEKLLAYLYEHHHATPFEMAGLVIEVKAPIFVFREWHRHRTQSYNEMSARYIPLPSEEYVPRIDDLVARSAAAALSGNRQASGNGRTCSSDEARQWVFKLIALYERAQTVYEEGLALGVPKELARLPVPVARYSRMRASANLRNWLAFLTLRMAPNAQKEIRDYAHAVGELIAECFPRTWALFDADPHRGR